MERPVLYKAREQAWNKVYFCRTYISILLSGMFCCWELLEVSSQLSPRVALGFHLSLCGRLCIHVHEWPLGWLALLSFHEMALGLIYRS